MNLIIDPKKADYVTGYPYISLVITQWGLTYKTLSATDGQRNVINTLVL